MYSAELKVGGCHTKCFSTSLIIASKYIDILYCYRAFPAMPQGVIAIDADTVDNLTEAINDISLLAGVAGIELHGGLVYVWWYIVSPTMIADIIALCDPVDPTIGVTYTDITSDPCDLISAWNCLTPDELCTVINHGYSILNVHEPDYGSVLPESLDTNFLNI
jgi:hypothetical protein